MSKCNKCKYEYSSKLDEPCKYCREKCGVVTLGYQMSEDKFVPKEEQPTTEYKGCDGCYYEWLGESDAPCCNCKYRFDPGTMARLKAKDCFKPKEEKALKVLDEIQTSIMTEHHYHTDDENCTRRFFTKEWKEIYQMPQDEEVEI